MTMSNLTPEQHLLDELDGIALRLFGPKVYAELDHDEAAAVVWESIRELCGTVDPPFDVGPRPEGWRPEQDHQHHQDGEPDDARTDQ